MGVGEGASEEDPVVRSVGEGEYTVCWDPLDGSSIVDNNWAVGTMIGIWGSETGLIGATGNDQKTALIALYGPRTTVLVALDDELMSLRMDVPQKDANFQTEHLNHGLALAKILRSVKIARLLHQRTCVRHRNFLNTRNSLIIT